MARLLTLAKAMVRRMLRIPTVRRVVTRLAMVAGAPPPLTADEKAIMGEGAAAERRLSEVEAERDALVCELATLRARLNALEALSKRAN